MTKPRPIALPQHIYDELEEVLGAPSPPRSLTPEEIAEAHREARRWRKAFEKALAPCERITGADLAHRVRRG